MINCGCNNGLGRKSSDSLVRFFAHEDVAAVYHYQANENSLIKKELWLEYNGDQKYNTQNQSCLA